MSGVAQRRLIRYPTPLAVNSLTGNESLYDALGELEQIYDLLPSGLATLDRKLRFLRVNPAFAEWANLPAVDVIGFSLIDVLPSLGSRLAPLMQQVIQMGTPVCTVAFSNEDMQAERRMTYFPLRDKKNRIQGLLLRLEKTREERRKPTRPEENRYRKGLAHMQRVSTLGVLASSLAHELNQPLTAILSNAQAALRYLSMGLLDDVREILKDIVSDDKRAGEVIHRLRVLLRKSELEYKALSVNAVIEDVWRILRSDAVTRRAVIQLELATELPFVYGDAVQLQQVLLNLMLNGLEAMKDVAPAKRVLVVSTRRPAADSLEISVRDAGSGLNKTNPEQVFEPFYTTKHDGLGMGLSIARSIIQSHAGRIWAEANADQGSTFHVTLPVRGDV